MDLSNLFIILEMISIVAALVAIANVLNGKERVILAEAGSMDTADDTLLHAKTPRQKRAYLLDDNGEVINTRKMLRIKVVGKCMEKKGILNGSQYYVRPIPKKINLNSEVKNGDILLIYYPPKNIHKIRVFEKFAENDELITYRYDVNTGEKKYSSKRHKRENIEGVISYPIAA